MLSMHICTPVCTLNLSITLSSIVAMCESNEFKNGFPSMVYPLKHLGGRVKYLLNWVYVSIYPFTYHFDFTFFFHTFQNKPFNLKLLIGHSTISTL